MLSIVIYIKWIKVGYALIESVGEVWSSLTLFSTKESDLWDQVQNQNGKKMERFAENKFAIDSKLSFFLFTNNYQKHSYLTSKIALLLGKLIPCFATNIIIK